jgi:hypothetical protein
MKTMVFLIRNAKSERKIPAWSNGVQTFMNRTLARLCARFCNSNENGKNQLVIPRAISPGQSDGVTVYRMSEQTVL